MDEDLIHFRRSIVLLPLFFCGAGTVAWEHEIWSSKIKKTKKSLWQ